MKKARLLCIVLLAFIFAMSMTLFTACSLSNNDTTDSATDTVDDSNTDSLTDSDTNSDTDSDTDSSTDTDSSADSDTDSSSDSDTDIPEPPKAPYYYASGSFYVDETSATALQNNSIAIANEKSFSGGTIYATVKPGNKLADNGVIFGVTNTTSENTFWEKDGVSYYFFFISQGGEAYLGKTTNGVWSVPGLAAIQNFDPTATYTIAASWNKSETGYDTINCYVNDVQYISYKETGTKLRGEEYGLRAGAAGTTFTDVKLTDEILGKEETLDDYTIANGTFKMTENGPQSSTGNAIAVKKDGKLANGTLEVTMTLSGAASDNGIIFSLTNNSTGIFWESDVSYYFFFTNKDGLAFLGKVDMGTWATCQSAYITNFDNAGTYTLKIERTNEDIVCFVNGVKYIDYTDPDPLTGTGYGLRAGSMGVTYSSINCVESSGEFVETYPDDLNVISGKVTGLNKSAKAASNNTLAIIKDTEFTQGTYTANVKATSATPSGLVFGYSEKGYYRFNTTGGAGSRVELVKVQGNDTTVLYSNYLSAGFSQGNSYPYKVVLKDGKAYCYFWNTLYTVADVQLEGSGVGIYAQNAGARFMDYTVTDDTTIATVDTILFGHSYFELWDDWKTDLAPYSDVFGTYTNVGIGGSVAAHWTLFEAGILAYQPKLAIYNIGINDLTGGTSPDYVAGQVKTLLLSLKEKLGEDFKVVLLGCAYCPARETIRTAIEETNVLYRNIAAQYDWIYFAEQENVFCDNGTTPDNHWFKDGLHPTAEGYRQKVLPAILSALRGENQPTLSEEEQQKLLNEAKETKACLLENYTVDAFRAKEWLVAQPVYAQAVQAINECVTINQVQDLDLTEYINQLKQIKNNADYVYERLTAGTTAADFEDETFTNALNSSTNGKYNLANYGHRLDDTYSYTDVTFTFRLSEANKNIEIAGVLFRATNTEGKGVNGYLINYVTANNYIQVWYLNNAYQAAGTPYLEYIGGWVFPETVENTLFRATVSGKYVYIYTKEDYVKLGKNSYGCSVDLTNNGKFALWENGGIGLLSWENGISFKMELSNINAAECHPSDEEQELKALIEAKQNAKEKLQNAYGATGYKTEDRETVENVLKEAYTAIEACQTAQEVNELQLTPFTERLDAIKTLTDYLWDNLSTGTNCESWEVTAFTTAINSSANNLYSISGDGHRLDASRQFSDVSLTFSAKSDGNLRFNGILLRAHQNEYLGLDGYLVNVMTLNDNNEAVNWVQVYELKNGYGSWGYCEYNYIGGWVYPGSVNGTEFTVKIEGNNLKVYDENGTLGVEVDLAASGRVPYNQGYVGLVSWGGANDNTMAIKNLKGTIVDDVEVSAKLNAALKENENCLYSNNDAITANDDGSFTSTGCAYRLYNNTLADAFSMTVKVSNPSGNTAIAGFLFRARKSSEGDGIDGYLLNFVSDGTNDFVQVFYLKNCYNTTNAAVICQYIGGLVLTGTGKQSTDTEITIYVRSNYITIASGNDHSECFLNYGDNAAYTSGGGFGILTWQEGYSADLSILSVKPY